MHYQVRSLAACVLCAVLLALAVCSEAVASRHSLQGGRRVHSKHHLQHRRAAQAKHGGIEMICILFHGTGLNGYADKSMKKTHEYSSASEYLDKKNDEPTSSLW